MEIALRSITGSSERGRNYEIQNPDPRDFSGNKENIPVMTAFLRTDLNINQERNNETCIGRIFENGVFPALKSIYD